MEMGCICRIIWLPYDDIDEECGFIGNAGYITVKVFLENELILTFDKVENRELNPWLFIYQPVSCWLHSRSEIKNNLKIWLIYAENIV